MCGFLWFLFGPWSVAETNEKFEKIEPSPRDVLMLVEEPLEKGREFLRKRDWKSAQDFFENQLGEDPFSLESVEGLSQSLIHLKKRSEAIQKLREFLKRSEKKADRQKVLEKISHYSGLFFQNEVFQVYQDGINLFSTAKYAAAEAKFQSCLHDEPDNLVAILRLSQVLVLQKKSAQAIKVLSKGLDLYPEHPQLLLWQGRALFLEGQHSKAHASFSKVLQKQPENWRSAVWGAESLQVLGSHQKARVFLEGAVGTGRAEPPIRLALLNLRLHETTEKKHFEEMSKELQGIESDFPAFVEKEKEWIQKLSIPPEFTLEQWRKEVLIFKDLLSERRSFLKQLQKKEKPSNQETSSLKGFQEFKLSNV